MIYPNQICMRMGQVNIGLVIEQKLNELGISKSEFGRKIGIPQQNVNRILSKASIDTDKLAMISEALGYNFFSEFIDATQQLSLSGNNNQVNGHGAHNNINGDINSAVLEERVKALEALLAEKERMIKLYEKMMEDKK